MSEIYDELYEAAKLDFESVKVLNKNNLFPPAIYHCAQTVEKSSKSIHAYYMINYENLPQEKMRHKFKKNYSHRLIESTKAIINSVYCLYIESEISKDKKSEEYRRLQYACNKIGTVKTDIKYIVAGFDILVDQMYQNAYQEFNKIANGSHDSLHPFYEYMKKQMSGANKHYLRYFLLVMILSSILDKLEIYSRYPMPEFPNYNNIGLLKSSSNKPAIDKLCKMIDELINLVPYVWKRIDYFKTSLENQP